MEGNGTDGRAHTKRRSEADVVEGDAVMLGDGWRADGGPADVRWDRQNERGARTATEEGRWPTRVGPRQPNEGRNARRLGFEGLSGSCR